jgi:hypothetical protein
MGCNKQLNFFSFSMLFIIESNENCRCGDKAASGFNQQEKPFPEIDD